MAGSMAVGSMRAAAIAGVLAWTAGCSEAREPVAVGTVPAVNLFLGDTGVVAASGYFTDPDGDPLSYGAVSSDGGVVAVSVSGDTVRLAAAGRGSATVAVTATDPGGLSAEQSVPVTVSNRAPEPVDTIPAQEVEVDDTVALAVSGYFADPDGDALGFAGVSSDTLVVTVRVSGDTVRLAGVARGDASVAVTATDPGGLSARQSFAVEVPDPQRAILEEFYESTGGDGWQRRDNWLTDAPLGEWWGVGTDPDGRVTYVSLSRNGLTGRLPAELGDLPRLTELTLRGNGLGGPIPAELGKLADLSWLDLQDNRLTGRIPAELGGLSGLYWLNLAENRLTGRIPAELGGLSGLAGLWLSANRLTGPIPPELGSLANVGYVNLSANRLTGPIPEALGNLESLDALSVSGNDLSGALPPKIGMLRRLRYLHVSDNAELAGELPAELTALHALRALTAGGTDLCAPTDSVFRSWLETVEVPRVRMCGFEPPAAYLVQSVQSRDFPVPLVAAKEALLRVFVTASVATDEGIPPVRARFYRGESVTYTANIPGKSTPIPTEVDEGSLAKSANAKIPAGIVQPGLEVVVEVDPDGTLDDSLGVVRRIPEEGRLELEVDSMPAFDLTVIPFLWEEDPDSSVLDATEGMAEDEEEHELLFDTYDLLPVEEMDVSDHDPVETSTNVAWELLREVAAIRAMEGGDGYYAGLMAGEVTGARGIAELAGWSSFSVVSGRVLAHEFGHNLSLYHAPCGGAPVPDPRFPSGDGTIGSWGYDFRGDSLMNPGTYDHMSYCDPLWTSDYSFSRAFAYRLGLSGSAEFPSAPQQTILLWGGLDADGSPRLHPAFVVDAPPALPGSPGPHSLTGRDGGGTELFSFSFAMSEIADGEGESASFVFLLPVRPGWAGALASIVLSGPGGSVTLDGNSDEPMAIVRDKETGQVRAILRGDTVPPAPRPGREVFLSRGIPAREVWKR